MAPTPKPNRSPQISQGPRLPSGFATIGLADVGRHHRHLRSSGLGVRRRRRRRVILREVDNDNDADASRTTDEESQGCEIESESCRSLDRSHSLWTYSLEVRISDRKDGLLLPLYPRPPPPSKQPQPPPTPPPPPTRALPLLRSNSSSTSPARRHARRRTIPQASNNYSRMRVKSSITDNDAASVSTSTSASLSPSASAANYPFRRFRNLPKQVVRTIASPRCQFDCQCCSKAAAASRSMSQKLSTSPKLPQQPKPPPPPPQPSPQMPLPSTTQSTTISDENSGGCQRQQRQDSQSHSLWYSCQKSYSHLPPQQRSNPMQHPYQYLHPHQHAQLLHPFLRSQPHQNQQNPSYLRTQYQRPDPPAAFPCPSSPDSSYADHRRANRPPPLRCHRVQATQLQPPYAGHGGGAFFQPQSSAWRWQPSARGYWTLGGMLSQPSSLISF